MFKDIVVPLTGTPGDDNAVAAALAIATAHESHLTVLEFANLPVLPADPWGGIDIGIDRLYRVAMEEADKRVLAWRERLSREAITLSSEARVVVSLFSESARLAALNARYSDLAVMTMAADAMTDGPLVRNFFSSLLLGSGRPVLMVPSRVAWRRPRHVVVAWQAKREATRALHDAMPFLHGAESIDLVVVGEVHGESGDGALPGADIAAHLARHGLKVNVVSRPFHPDPVAETLLKHAQETRADLLVSGGYGHSRFREWALGGVTRDLVAGSGRIPILFSH